MTLREALEATKSCTGLCDHEGVEWHYVSVDAFADALSAALAATPSGGLTDDTATDSLPPVRAADTDGPDDRPVLEAPTPPSEEATELRETFADGLSVGIQQERDLDVDRLGRAIATHAAGHKAHSRTHVRQSCAAAVAAEYARLTEDAG